MLGRLSDFGTVATTDDGNRVVFELERRFSICFQGRSRGICPYGFCVTACMISVAVTGGLVLSLTETKTRQHELVSIDNVLQVNGPAIYLFLQNRKNSGFRKL